MYRRSTINRFCFFVCVTLLLSVPFSGTVPARAGTGESPLLTGSPSGKQAYRTAFLDRLTEEGSKEGKMLEGVTSIFSSSREVDYETERTIGEGLALEGFRRYGLPVADEGLQTYVNTVGAAVARNSGRPSIPYFFVVVDNGLQNAFSCPGGIIFICSGLLDTMADESQLACLLAHEVAHVSHKHALRSIKRAQFFQGLGQLTSAAMEGEKGEEFESMIGDLQTVLFDKGLDRNMEFEADTSAMETAFRTGYDPAGMVEVLENLQKIQQASETAGSWFSTHPPLKERIEKCTDRLSQYPDRGELARGADRYQRHVKGVKQAPPVSAK